MVALDGVYSVCVIGAGPAGLAAVGKLLEKTPGRLLWIDPLFKCGRLSKYKAVPR